MKALPTSNALPLYLQLEEIIRKDVANGQLRPGELLPREEELCRTYKVSPITVKRALVDLTRGGLLMRIKSKGTFVRPDFSPKPPATVSMPARRKLLSFIVPDIEDLFLHEIYQGVESVAGANGYLVSVLSSNCDVSKEVKNLEFLKEGMAEGAIIFPFWGRANVTQLLELKKMRFPFVLIDRFYRDMKTDMVVVDNFSGGCEAARHLLSLGHRKIAHIMGVECTANEDRFEGYLSALNKAGIQPLPSLVRKIQPFEAEDSIRFEPDDVGGYNETLALLKQKERPTAIFAGNDYIALGCLKALKEKGICVPRDMALVGFDDLSFSVRLEIPLTTVHQPKFEIGRQATELLLKRLQEKQAVEKPEPVQLVLKTELVVRESSGAIRSRPAKTEGRKSKANNLQLAV
ncbi:MAG: GntR family transcriptional regulator [Verrucomicrobiae bacterium]|nr:GntR family transcriptional regulator [Verrucomicrobiae bacterium]